MASLPGGAAAPPPDSAPSRTYPHPQPTGPPSPRRPELDSLPSPAHGEASASPASLRQGPVKQCLDVPLVCSVRTSCGQWPVWAPLCPTPPRPAFQEVLSSQRPCWRCAGPGPLLQGAREKRGAGGSSDAAICSLSPALAAKLWRGQGASPRPAGLPMLAFCPQEARAACHRGFCPHPAGLGLVTLNSDEARHTCPPHCPQLRPRAGEGGHSDVVVKFAAFWERDTGGRGLWEASVRSM